MIAVLPRFPQECSSKSPRIKIFRIENTSASSTSPRRSIPEDFPEAFGKQRAFDGFFFLGNVFFILKLIVALMIWSP
jgi:hypothetical protein